MWIESEIAQVTRYLSHKLSWVEYLNLEFVFWVKIKSALISFICNFPQKYLYQIVILYLSGKWFCDANHWSMDAFTVTQYKTPWSGCRYCSTLITFNHFFGSGSCHSDFGCSGLLLYCQRKSSIALPGKYRILELKNKFPNYVYTTTRGFNLST